MKFGSRLPQSLVDYVSEILVDEEQRDTVKRQFLESKGVVNPRELNDKDAEEFKTLSEDKKKIVKEASNETPDIQRLAEEPSKIQYHGFTSIHHHKDHVIIAHNGNMGHTEDKHVKPNVDHMLGKGAFNHMRKAGKESGSPDYSYAMKIPKKHFDAWKKPKKLSEEPNESADYPGKARYTGKSQAMHDALAAIDKHFSPEAKAARAKELEAKRSAAMKTEARDSSGYDPDNRAWGASVTHPETKKTLSVSQAGKSAQHARQELEKRYPGHIIKISEEKKKPDSEDNQGEGDEDSAVTECSDMDHGKKVLQEKGKRKANIIKRAAGKVVKEDNAIDSVHKAKRTSYPIKHHKTGKTIGHVWKDSRGDWNSEHSGTGMSWSTDNRKDAEDIVRDHHHEKNRKSVDTYVPTKYKNKPGLHGLKSVKEDTVVTDKPSDEKSEPNDGKTMTGQPRDKIDIEPEMSRGIMNPAGSAGVKSGNL